MLVTLAKGKNDREVRVAVDQARKQVGPFEIHTVGLLTGVGIEPFYRISGKDDIAFPQRAVTYVDHTAIL
ncbi:unnamed protein product, partial [marine sediment metagenome]